MTTAVTIKMTTPHNDKDIMVDVIDVIDGSFNVGAESEVPAAVSESIRVRDGEETEVYVHDTRSFSVHEVDKEVALDSEDTEGTDNAEPAVAGAGDSGDAEEADVHTEVGNSKS